MNKRIKKKHGLLNKKGESPRENKKKISIRIGYATAAAQEISGDTVISCRLPGGSRALMLSDGMGRGSKAAVGSRCAVQRLRKNLKAGMPVPKALREVNRFLLENHLEEVFSTIDLVIINEEQGKARFYKMGAATSYLVREEQVRKLQRAALPAGIIQEATYGELSTSLYRGDILIMVSDGITEANHEDFHGVWLKTFLKTELKNYKNRRTLSPRHMAERILLAAQAQYIEREPDDLTVAVGLII